jgi:hypothetical protein
MKTFSQIREKLGRMPSGEHVKDYKLSGIPVMIHKEKGRFVVYIDGDRLDAYKNLPQAEKMAKMFVKQYKG